MIKAEVILGRNKRPENRRENSFQRSNNSANRRDIGWRGYIAIRQQSHMSDVISKAEGFLDIDRGEYAVLMFAKSSSDSPISCSTRADVQKWIVAWLLEDEHIHSPNILRNDQRERLKPAEGRSRIGLNDVEQPRTECKTSKAEQSRNIRSRVEYKSETRVDV